MRKLGISFVFLLVSCVNPYAQFYRGLEDARLRPGYEHVQTPLEIYSTDNFDRDRLTQIRRGFYPVGHASFNAASNQVSEAQLREQAQKIGAHVVLVTSKYTHTVSGAVPLVLPQTTTSYSTGTATAYGSGGVVNAYGSGTTTTYGSQTMMMPYSVTRSDFGALYFAKSKSRIGIYPEPLDDDIRRRLQTNSGIKVLVVTEGTSAFRADILPGDIVLAIDNDVIQSVDHYIELLNKYEGKKVSLRLNREGKILEKLIDVLSYTK